MTIEGVILAGLARRMGEGETAHHTFWKIDPVSRH